MRADYRLFGGNLSATFTGGHPYLAQASVLPEQMRVWARRTRRASASYAVARGRWSSETRFGYSYNWLSRTDPWFNTLDPKASSSTEHRGVPRLSFTGITTPEGEQHIRGTQPSYSFEQQMTLVTDRHAFKFGGIYFPFRGGRWNYAAPSMSFQNINDLMNNLIINGGWGLMFQPFDTQNFEPSIGNVQLPRSLTYSVQEAAARGLAYPTYSNDLGRQLLAAGGSPIVGLLIDPRLQAPSAMVTTLGFQRALGASRVLEMSYVGTRGYDISLYRTYNQPDRVTGIRPNPNLGQGNYYDNSQRTRYHALQASFRQRPVHDLSFNVNYTWSRAMAHAGGDGTPGFIGDSTNNVQDFFDVASEWGPAAGDITHLAIGSVIYEVPSDSFSAPAARRLLVTQSSQRAGSRPDVTDFDNAINKDCCGVGNLQYLNRAAFQQVPVNAVSRQTIRRGNVGNNAFRGPGSRNVDLSIVKSVPFGGFRRLELRADMLNAMNWTNFRTIQTAITAANFGQVTGTANPRVIQVQARFGF